MEYVKRWILWVANLSKWWSKRSDDWMKKMWWSFADLRIKWNDEYSDLIINWIWHYGEEGVKMRQAKIKAVFQ